MSAAIERWRPRMVLCGEWRIGIYEAALAEGFGQSGYEVIPFETSAWLGDTLACKIQKRLLAGPRLDACGRAFHDALRRARPDVVFLRLPQFLSPSEIALARGELPGACFVSYCNDNPYEDGRRWRLWRRYHRTIRLCDVNFFFRVDNVLSAQYEGVPRPRLAPPYYTEALHRPLAEVLPEYRSEVVFAGHFEPDGRHRFIEALLDAGIEVRVYGTGWERAPAGVTRRLLPIRPVDGEEYVSVLNGARVVLAFLSRLNRDYWTSRCMEIPACGSAMAAQRNPVLEEIFEPGREAVYFDTPRELVEAVRELLRNPTTRDALAANGRKKCLSRGFSNIAVARSMAREFAAGWESRGMAAA